MFLLKCNPKIVLEDDPCCLINFIGGVGRGGAAVVGDVAVEDELSILNVVEGVWWILVGGPHDGETGCRGAFENLNCSLIMCSGEDCSHGKIAFLCGVVTD